MLRLFNPGSVASPYITRTSKCSSEMYFSSALLSGSARHKMDALSTANVEFCLDMFKELNNNSAGDNIFFSPLSLLYALSMILLGARGNSAQQVEKVRNARGVSPQPVGQPNRLHFDAKKTLPSCEGRTLLGNSYFLTMDNGLNKAIHYNENSTIHAIQRLLLTIGGFTGSFLQFTIRVNSFSHLNMTENTRMVLFLPSRSLTCNKTQ